MRKSKRRPKVYRSLAWRITAFTLALWLAGVGILTWCVASDMLNQMNEQVGVFINTEFRAKNDDTALPGSSERNMISKLGYPYFIINLDSMLPVIYKQHLDDRINGDDWLWGKWDLFYGFEAAVIYYDQKDEIIAQTGDYLTFSYTTENKWVNQDTTAVGNGYVVLDELPGGADFSDNLLTEHPLGSSVTSLFIQIMRLTGYFEGNEFHPTSVDSGYYVSYEDVSKLAVLDSKNKIEWVNMLTVPVEEGLEQETIYAWDVDGFNCTQHSVSVKGKTFNSLTELLHHDKICGEPYSYQQNSLFESILINRKTYEDSYGTFTVAVAVRCKPLQYAFLRLVGFYIVSFVIVALCLWLILRRLKKHLTSPIERMVQSARDGTVIIPDSSCAEIYDLEQHFSETQQTLSENKAELQQLHTALDYAHDAEEKRKQLISNITHELKTPLAIIHSYAECLQEDISKEKQERYLETILDETERMDAMVVQMLDLSRLEAGKIRLSSDQFSLLALTKAIAERMKPLFEARKLTLHYDFVQDFTITADEARIEQVITNLLTNAQKYTTEGGAIRVKVYLIRGSAYFYIRNTAEHLSDEALEKVWDSFYRADESRNTAGVGLGLSLVKSIITLHGGTCSVRNLTSEQGMHGVEFGFILPLK